ncbi:MAG: hypothetical protein ACHQRO_03310 [Vicinamibacteria bacterium]
MRIPPRGGWLLAGAAASFALVVLHVGVIVVGAPAYAFFLAGDRMVDMAQAHSLVPTIVTGAVAFVFAVFGSYALAGAGLLELPATRVLVAAIGCVYTLRGLLIVPEALMVHFLDRPTRALVFAAISLAIGVIHLVGIARRWTALAPAAPADHPVR